MRYRKLSVEVEAVVWDGGNDDEVRIFASTHSANVMPTGDGVVRFNPPISLTGGKPTMTVWIAASRTYGYTLPVGTALIAEGDALGVYPCLPDVFQRTYEAVQ